MSSLGLSTPGCALRRRAAPVVVDGARGNRNATSRPPRRSRGLATSQTMDGSPSLRRRASRRRYKLMGRILAQRPLVCPLCTEPLAESYRSNCDAKGFVRNGSKAQISLKKLSSIPSDGEACGVSEKGCLGDGSWAASLALCGQHFRKPIDRSQAGEAPEVLSGRRKEEFVLSSVWSSQTQTGQTKDSLEVRE